MVSVHDCPTLLLWVYGMTGHHVGQCLVDEATYFMATGTCDGEEEEKSDS